MAYDPVRLYQGSPNTTPAAQLFAVTKPTIVKQILIANTNTTAQSLTLHLVPNSGGSVGTASAGNMIMGAIAVPPNTTLTFDTSLVLGAVNDALFAFQSGTLLNLSIHGVTY
jgi:hypothetical protein